MFFVQSMTTANRATTGRFEMTVGEFSKRAQARVHLCERLTSPRETKPYFDGETYHDMQPSPEQIGIMGKAFVDNVNKVFEGQTGAPPLVVTASRHGVDPRHAGKYKVSFRAWVTNYRVEYTKLRDAIVNAGLSEYFDIGVYKAAEQLLGCVKCSKAANDPRVLLPSDPDEPMESFVVQHLRGNEEPFVLVQRRTEDIGVVAKKKTIEADVDKRMESPIQNRWDDATDAADGAHGDAANVDAELLKACVGLVDAKARASRYPGWRDLGWALKDAGRVVGDEDLFFDDFVDLSRRCPGYERVSYKECMDVWRSDRGLGVTYKTLLVYAKEDNTAGFAAAQAAFRQRKTGREGGDCGIESDAEQMSEKLQEMMDDRWPGHFTDVKVGNANHRVIDFTYADGKQGRVDLAALTVHDGAGYLGLLPTDVIVHGPWDIGEVRADTTFRYERPKHDYGVLTEHVPPENESRHKVHMYYGDGGITSMRLGLPGGKEKLLTKRVKDEIQSAVRRALESHAQNVLVQVNVNINNFSNCSFDRGSEASALACGGGASTAKTPEYLFIHALRDVGLLDDILAGDDRGDEFHMYDAATGLWGKKSLELIAGIIRRSAMEDGPLGRRLGKGEAQYLLGCYGPKLVLKSVLVDLYHPDILRRLDELPPGQIAFDNGLYDVATDTLRPFQRTDYVTQTIGYAYDPDADASSFITGFYEQVFPDVAERTYFQWIVASALFDPCKARKHVIVLTDESEGNTGKTTVMRGVERVFGIYKAKAERSFLGVQTFVNCNGPSDAFLEYKGKRLAYFDETSADQKIDMGKLKELTSGCAAIVGRNSHARHVQEHPWTALIAITCNEGNFPSISSSDKPFLKRLKVLKMRSKFVSDDEYEAAAAEDDAHVFRMRDDIMERLRSPAGLAAHFRTLADVYRRHQGTIVPEPPCVAEMVDKIAEDADARMPHIDEFLEERVVFDPPRTADQKGKKYYAYLSDKELCRELWSWVNGNSRRVGPLKGNKSQWSTSLRAAMERRGAAHKRRSMRVTVDGQLLPAVLGYDRVAWAAGVGLDDL